MSRLVAKHPIRPRRQPMQQPLRTQKVHIGESCKEKQSLDTRSKTDQVEQELLTVVTCMQAVELVDGVDPLETKICLLFDRRYVLDRRECRGTFVVIRNVRVEQRQVKLHM